MNRKKYKGIKKIGNHVFYSLDEVFGKHKRTKEYQQAYRDEIARLALVRQIRQARIARKLTQSAFAKRVSMPQSVIARLESGEHGFSIATLERVAAALGKKVALV